jgi:hypothetical protein
MMMTSAGWPKPQRPRQSQQSEATAGSTIRKKLQVQQSEATCKVKGVG